MTVRSSKATDLLATIECQDRSIAARVTRLWVNQPASCQGRDKICRARQTPCTHLSKGHSTHHLPGKGHSTRELLGKKQDPQSKGHSTLGQTPHKRPGKGHSILGHSPHTRLGKGHSIHQLPGQGHSTLGQTTRALLGMGQELLIWTPESSAAFKLCQQAISNCQELYFLEDTAKPMLQTDTDYGIGGYLYLHGI